MLAERSAHELPLKSNSLSEYACVQHFLHLNMKYVTPDKTVPTHYSGSS